MPTISPQLLDDLPAQDDLILWPGLRSLAAQLAEILPRLPQTSPILISGDWGSGKTTLLHAVRRHLGEAPTVWFDAWRHEGGGPLLPALMRKVWEATPQALQEDEKAKVTFRTVFNAAVSIGLRVAPALIGAGVTGGLLPAAVGVVGEAAKGINLGGVGMDQMTLGKATTLEVPPDPTSLLWSQFAVLVRTAWPGQSPVIFIDDLDRCSPAGAVTLLDDLRLLVSSGADLGLRFVVAMDRAVLVQAIAHKFEGISGYDGNRYLEKVFPITFTLPAPQGRDVARLVTSFLAPTAGVAMNTDHQDALSAALNDPTFANPRLMKRVINRFRLVVAFEGGASAAPARSAADTATQDRTLARWIAATERFPQLRRLLVQHGEEYWRELEGALATPGARPPADAERLIQDEGALPWVRREILGGGAGRLAQYREAEARLRRWGL